jgi:hypothetical protein
MRAPSPAWSSDAEHLAVLSQLHQASKARRIPRVYADCGRVFIALEDPAKPDLMAKPHIVRIDVDQARRILAGEPMDAVMPRFVLKKSKVSLARSPR